MENFISPRRVITSEKVTCHENLLKKKHNQMPLIREGLDCGLPKDCTRIDKDGYVLLDFGKELLGGIRVFVQSISDVNTKLKITFGESVMETLTELGEKNSGNFHAIHVFEIPAVRLSMQRVGDIGFRFVKIEAKDGDVSLYNVTAIPDIRDLEYKGSFQCNDELLNEIWKTGAYTVQLNVHDYIWDGAKRDRIVWVGDMHPEVATVNAVFGKDESVPRSLDFVKEWTPANAWMNGIVTYSMWWIIIHHDWYMHWGDYEYLKEQKEYLKELTENTIKLVENGLVVNEEGMEGFVDWSSRFTPSEKEGRKTIICLALSYAAKLLDVLGETECSGKCKACVDALREEEISEEFNKRISALTVLSGRDKKIAQKVISGNSAEEMSCFFGYYVLKAKAELGEYSDALDIIREYWGGMLSMGATTFWEDFDILWMENSARIDEVTPYGKKDIHGDFGRHCYRQFRHSLCHGWASGPTPFLSEQIAGIEILEPGCKKLKIQPNMGDLEWIKVSYPTPFGNVVVEAEKVEGKTNTKISAPEEIEIVSVL